MSTKGNLPEGLRATMEEAEKVAQQFLRVISKKIREENPQKELGFLNDL